VLSLPSESASISTRKTHADQRIDRSSFPCEAVLGSQILSLLA
jgi:hypothetical protein